MGFELNLNKQLSFWFLRSYSNANMNSLALAFLMKGNMLYSKTSFKSKYLGLLNESSNGSNHEIYYIFMIMLFLNF